VHIKISKWKMSESKNGNGSDHDNNSEETSTDAFGSNIPTKCVK
jgi:hypothetical protein